MLSPIVVSLLIYPKTIKEVCDDLEKSTSMHSIPATSQNDVDEIENSTFLQSLASYSLLSLVYIQITPLAQLFEVLYAYRVPFHSRKIQRNWIL